MAVRFYLDVHIPRAIVQGLRLRGIDLLTAQDDGAERLDDDALLARATALGRVLVTSDHDFLAITDACRQGDRRFSGVILVHPIRVSIGGAVKDLELVATAGEAVDLADRVEFLPLRKRV
jgi:hypothetical protein